MRPGTRVVCVDDSMIPEIAEWQPKHCPNWVKKDQEYTIREFDDNDGIVDGVLLEEVVNPILYLPKWSRVIEPRFAAWRFRELEDDQVEETVTSKEEVAVL
jgi:hypothetical protein